ncbi:hypothetical protein [Sphingobacterium multivorum]|uniref:hypothetical protein n=1 Tax=Sphingobacterium multivorum TaxID=28454 RepID=UPI0031BAC1FB
MLSFYPMDRLGVKSGLCLLYLLAGLATSLFAYQNKIVFQAQQQTGNRLPSYITDQGTLCYNLPVDRMGIYAIQVDLNRLFPTATAEHLRSKHYELSDSTITIINYAEPAISISYKIIDNTFVIAKSSNLLGDYRPEFQFIALDSLRHMENLFDTNDLSGLMQLEIAKLPFENILLFFSQLHGFSTVEEFSSNAIHRILEKGQYAIAKQFYHLFLAKNRQFNDFEILKMAIEKNDMDFIRKTSLNSLNRLGIDEIKADYSFTQCTLLGKAILIKNKIIVDYLLQNGANTEKVYQYESDVLSAFQLAERTKSKKIMKLFQ